MTISIFWLKLNLIRKRRKNYPQERLWKVYRRMYQDCFRNCNKAPWTIVPSDQNWYKEYIIAKKLLQLLRSLKMQYPGLKK